MISIDFTPQDIDALHHQRFPHPHPRVQLKMEAVYLKSPGLPHQEICRLTRISENTLRSYLRQHQAGGIERLQRTDWAGTTSDLDDHRQSLEDSYRENPPRATGEAAAVIEQRTGIRRGPTQVRRFDSSVFKCKTDRKGPSALGPSGGSARSTSRSPPTPDSGPGSDASTDCRLTSARTPAW